MDPKKKKRPSPSSASAKGAGTSDPVAAGGKGGETTSSESIDRLRRPITVTIDERTYRALRLCASVEGTTISAIVVDALDHEVPTRLKAALAEIADVESRS